MDQGNVISSLPCLKNVRRLKFNILKVGQASLANPSIFSTPGLG